MTAVLERHAAEAARPNRRKAPREHGTYACYVFGPSGKKTTDGCRCDECRAAKSTYERDRKSRAVIEPPYVDAGPAREHVEYLSANGVGLKQIARITDVAHGTLWKLVYGMPSIGRPPSKRIRRTTADAILAITPSDGADGSRVPAGPTWELVNKIVAAGVPKIRIAERLGQKGAGLQLSRSTVTRGSARRIAEMAAELEAGTLVTVRRSRHGDCTLQPPAPPAPDPQDELRDQARRGQSRRRQAVVRARERGEDEPEGPIIYDDIDQLYLDMAMALEARLDQAAWRAGAACRGRSAWMWTTDHDLEATRTAKKICGACTVRAECLEANRDVPEAIYGGLTGPERTGLTQGAA